MSFAEKLSQKETALAEQIKITLNDHAGLKELLQNDWARIKEIHITKKDIL